LLDKKRAAPFNRKAVIVTGELSGEIHALHLVQAINESLPLHWSGMGSTRLNEAGVSIVHDYKDISVTGLTEMFWKMGHIWRAYAALKHHLEEVHPSLLVLVDFPGFNLKMARLARRLGIPTIYFIPPQIWAWHESRIETLRTCIDLVISILPFEKQLYDRHAVPAVYVGHPFMTTVRSEETKEQFLGRLGLSQRAPIITLMPGSRENEIRGLMPLISEVARYLRPKLPGMACLLPVAKNIDRRFVEQFVGAETEITVLEGHAREALAASDAAIVASGSATLEAAILDCPTVVIYKISALSYLIARLVVNVKYISLPNLIAGREVFPEYVQQLQPERIAEKLLHVIHIERARIKNDMEEVRKKLGASDSYLNARDAVFRFLEQTYGPLS
jgi:lipid-A-disaccharide synthase